ncbi:uncharacterized protein C8R40DRAFT_1265355 [Lentinula edodes]|uniref:uncharacterized protein n=1 Tax=Lentinula edodes TaxID=5353 RepID=UPI001E8DC559|nr:uncharacterized protein C8R40DRAFT_1265355 [Lentinula edodes]KAH7875248.1 hypothetical protein C8R40DRAFT_1265355 [Lentinula edodes]
MDLAFQRLHEITKESIADTIGYYDTMGGLDTTMAAFGTLLVMLMMRLTTPTQAEVDVTTTISVKYLTLHYCNFDQRSQSRVFRPISTPNTRLYQDIISKYPSPVLPRLHPSAPSRKKEKIRSELAARGRVPSDSESMSRDVMCPDSVSRGFEFADGVQVQIPARSGVLGLRKSQQRNY